MHCHYCGKPLPEGQRGIYCGNECKKLAGNRRRNLKAAKVCRLCGRGPRAFQKALWDLYRVVNKGVYGGADDRNKVVEALRVIDQLRAAAKAEREKAKEAHAQAENA